MKKIILYVFLLIPVMLSAEVTAVDATNNASVMHFEIGINPGTHFYSDAVGYQATVDLRLLGLLGDFTLGLRGGISGSGLSNFNVFQYEVGLEIGYVMELSPTIRILPQCIISGAFGTTSQLMVTPAVSFDYYLIPNLTLGLELGYRLPFVFVGTTTLLLQTPYINLAINYQVF